MALKLRTVMTYPLNGSTVDFSITFEYLARKFVSVTLIGKDRKELVLNQDFRFTTKTQITTTNAWSPSDGYTMIEIRRYTSATDRLVDFADGSILRAYDLNIAQIQTLHVAEEARDLTADTVGVNNDGHLDSRGRRIVNVADPVEGGDAVNLRTIKSWNDSAFNSMNAAKVSENNAKASEIRSVQAETRSVQAETRSITAETNSKDSETMAKKWAVNPIGEIVVNNMFSSFHYANQANLSAGAAKTSANNSASSASASASSAVASKNEADRAKIEADKLGNMNDLVGTIESVDKVTNTVTFKGLAVSGSKAVFHTGDTMWVEIIGHIPDKSNWNTNGLRIINRNARTTDIYNFEYTDSYHSLMFHVYQKGNQNTPEAYYEFRNTGDLTTSGFNITKSGRVQGSAYENGFLDDWVRKYFVGDVYLGSEVWLEHHEGYQDLKAPAGYVQTGTTVQDRGVRAIWARPVWISYPNGEKRIVVSV